MFIVSTRHSFFNPSDIEISGSFPLIDKEFNDWKRAEYLNSHEKAGDIFILLQGGE